MNQEQAGVGSAAVQRMFDSSLCRMQYDLGADCEPWSVAYFGGVKMPGIDLYCDEGIGGRHALRTGADIAASPADDFLLAMPFSASIDHVQLGQIERCEPGQAMLFSTSRPFDSVIAAATPDSRYSQFLSKISGSLLRQRVPQIDGIACLLFDVSSGAGQILKSLFDVTIAEATVLSEGQQRLLASMLIDAVANVVIGATLPAGPAVADSSAQRIRRQALNYIENSLSDSALDVSMVARHCGVSVRYLHSVFATDSIRVGAWIRERRLQACRRSLLDPAMCSQSITQIAFAWGFDDSAHFSHAYKARFGCCPSRDRLGRTSGK